MMLRSAAALGAIITLAFSAPSAAQMRPGTGLIDQKLLSEIRGLMEREIVQLSIADQNKKYQDVDQGEIERLDAQWVEERAGTAKPLVSATLSNPLSAYLTRIQAHSGGLYTEIFVMDANGLNVGQSSITSDYWQGDEAKWQKTYRVGSDAVFIDEPEWHDATRTWRAQVNLALTAQDGSGPIGAATVEINLTELQRRQDL